MRVYYDKEADVLLVRTSVQSATSASLLHDPDIVVDLSEPEGHDIVGLSVMWASGYLPLKKGYDPEADTLLLGLQTTSPGMITENGDFVGYWQPYEDEPDGFMDPVGVLLRNASKHLAAVSGLADTSARQSSMPAETTRLTHQ